MIAFGIDLFFEKEWKRFRGERLGILCNQASVDHKLRHIRELALDPKKKLKVGCFLGPQQGIYGEKQDNMIESEDFTDPISHLPIYSLYGKTRIPTPEMMKHFEVLIVDLQDIGSRVYTFMYTLANCMRKAKEFGKKVVVLDRPNPVGGIQIEGNCLDPAFSSFVGQFPICVRHGMTMGELATLFNQEYQIGCELEIIKLKGWQRNKDADQWKREWIPITPNVPNTQSVQLFSGSVFFEGTHLSEGRGTTRPFEYIGAPYIDADKLAKQMNGKRLPGVYFRANYFQPCYQKWSGEVCGGVQIHIIDKKRMNSFQTGLTLLKEIRDSYPDQFKWKSPPYEYEEKLMPIDLIAGTDRVRKLIDKGEDLSSFLKEVKEELTSFQKIRRHYLLYR